LDSVWSSVTLWPLDQRLGQGDLGGTAIRVRPFTGDVGVTTQIESGASALALTAAVGSNGGRGDARLFGEINCSTSGATCR